MAPSYASFGSQENSPPLQSIPDHTGDEARLGQEAKPLSSKWGRCSITHNTPEKLKMNKNASNKKLQLLLNASQGSEMRPFP